MPENPQTAKKSITPDWLVQGVLTKIGDTFDRLTGRGWKPSSSLATSELIERLKQLLDAEMVENEDKRKFVPHNIKLKMQWDKFSADAGDSLQTLENELLTAAVDHINDKRYYTFAPLSIEVKNDYFTSGVKLFVSFDKFSGEDHEAEMDVAIPGTSPSDLSPVSEVDSIPQSVIFRYSINGQPGQKVLRFNAGSRLSVGRTKENDLALDDPSVSKMHASLVIDSEGRLRVADTGSTNGTFIDGERISYGKAIEVGLGSKLRFGTVDAEVEFVAKPADAEPISAELPKTESYRIGEFEFSQGTDKTLEIQHQPPAETEAAVIVPELEVSTNPDQ